MIVDEDLSVAELFASAGWQLEPDGACQGDVCVPLGSATSLPDVAERLGMAIVEDPTTGVRALGPPSLGSRVLPSAEAPDLELPLALSEGTWRLASQRGRRTVVVAWAPW